MTGARWLLAVGNTAPGSVSTFWVDTVNDRRIPCVWATGTNRGGLSCDWGQSW